MQEVTPPALLYRVARTGQPLAWPDWSYSGSNRFDTLGREFRTLYAADDPATCFLETLAPLRPNLAHLARAAALPAGEDGDDLFQGGTVSADWCAQRTLASFQLLDVSAALDLRGLKTREALRRELAPVFMQLGLDDFDAGDALSRSRPLTQEIARWAFAHGYRALAYQCRLDPSRSCWAIFDTARIEPIAQRPISPHDSDFQTALTTLRLKLRQSD